MATTTPNYSSIKVSAPVETQEKKKATSVWWPYFKLTRLHLFPIGTLVVYWPCAFGILMSARHLPDATPQYIAFKIAQYFLWMTIRHSGACVWNDICDVEFDKKVERSKSRPLASGEASVTGAYILVFVHILLCALVMAPQGRDVLLLSMLALFPIDYLYPLMKRWTYWPQAFLGIAIAWGAPTAWLDMTGTIDWNVILPICFGSICWTVYFDTIYACQDRKDDQNAGVKSTAVLFAEYDRPILALFAASFIGCLLAAGILNSNGIPYFAVTIGLGALHFLWQISTVDLNRPSDCLRFFVMNGNLGVLFCAGMLLDIVQHWL